MWVSWHYLQERERGDVFNLHGGTPPHLIPTPLLS